MEKIAVFGPKMTLKITDTEIATAKQVKEDVKDVLKKLDLAARSILDLKDAVIQQRPSQDDLSNKYRGRFLRYRRNMTRVFNELASSVKMVIDKLSTISDPDMIRLKEILVAEISEFSDGTQAVLDLLKEPDRAGFTNTLERISVQIDKRNRSIKDVIDNQLIGHIDNDILGKMKISELRFNIRRRSRIIKQLAREE